MSADTSLRTSPPGPWWLARVGEQRFLIPMAEVQDVVSDGRPTPVPHLAPWISGVVEHRGSLRAVADLDRFLGLPPTAPQALIIPHPKVAAAWAWRVDAVEPGPVPGDVLPFEPVGVEPLEAAGGFRPAFAHARLWWFAGSRMECAEVLSMTEWALHPRVVEWHA